MGSRCHVEIDFAGHSGNLAEVAISFEWAGDDGIVVEAAGTHQSAHLVEVEVVQIAGDVELRQVRDNSSKQPRKCPPCAASRMPESSMQ